MAVSILSTLFPTTSGGSVTVPSGAQGVIAFVTHYNAGSSLNTISLGGASSFTIAQNLSSTGTPNFYTGQALAHATISSTGSQTFSFSFTGGAPTEGPTIGLVFVDGIDTSDWIRATDADQQTGSTNPSSSVTSNTTDLVIASDQKYNTIPDSISGWTSQGTVTNNSEGARISTANSSGASSTTFTATNSDYSTTALVSIKAGTGGGGSTGTVARTNANDTCAASGTTTVVGSVSRTNANDTLSATGTTTIVGTVNRTNSNDTSSASGSPVIVGTLARTNANDTLVASGSVGSAATGSVAVTNQNDILAASGTTTVTGTANVTLNNDTISASGSSGSAVSGTVAVTNQNDTSAIQGTTTVVGTVNRTNQNDTMSASGTTTVTGTVARTNQNDTLAATGTSGNPPASSPTKLPMTGVGT